MAPTTVRVHAELRDERDRPLADTPVRIRRVLLRGGTRIVGQGRTDDAGRVEVETQDLEAGQTSLLLEAYHRRAYRVVATRVVPEGLPDVVFAPVRVTASKVADIDDVAVHGVTIEPEAARLLPKPGEVAVPPGGFRPIEPDRDLPQPKELAQLQEQLQLTTHERDAARASLAQLNEDLAGVRNNLTRLETTNARLAQEQDRLRLQTDELRGELLDVAGQRDAHLAALEDARIRIRDLEQQLDAEQAAEIAVTELLARTGEQFGEVNDRLDASRSAYRLGDVQVEMKVLLSSDSKRARLPGLSDLTGTDPTGFTVLTVDFERPTPGAATDEPVVPDVRGYTGPMATRRLQAAGLRARAVARYVSEDRAAADHGRVLEQRPGPGQRLAPGEEVELLVGRAER